MLTLSGLSIAAFLISTATLDAAENSGAKLFHNAAMQVINAQKVAAVSPYFSPSPAPISQVRLIAQYQQAAFLTLDLAIQIEQSHMALQHSSIDSENFSTLVAQFEYNRAAYAHQLSIENAALQAASINEIPTGATLAALREMLGL